jgi:diguanylate cyclase (GGDEF)-like protein
VRRDGVSRGGSAVPRRRRLALLGILGASACLALQAPAAALPLFVPALLAGAVFFCEGGAAVACAGAGVVLLVVHGGSGLPFAPGLLGFVVFALSGLAFGRLVRGERRARRALAATTLTDGLTGLYNYAAFADALERELHAVTRYGGSLALVMLDVDHFKRFNDRHGHAAGNALLAELGAALRRLLRGADLAARYGGEEFAVLIRGEELDGLRLAERIRTAVLTLRVPVADGEAWTSVSAGVAACPPGTTAADLVAAADAALYASKQGGRNCVTGHTLGRLTRARRRLRAVGT